MVAPVEKLEKHDLLARFQAKARCYHTQKEAMRLWLRLCPFLTEKQKTKISIGWGHIKDCRLPPSEMDEACKEVFDSWKKEKTFGKKYEF